MNILPTLSLSRCLKKLTHQSHQTTVRMVFFPHAGASASIFSSWVELMPSNIEMFAVEYPGRGGRISENAVCDPQNLINEIAHALELLPNKPCIFFGHSLGGRLALAVSLIISKPPIQLIVSGCTTPYLTRHNHFLRLTRNLMIDELIKSGMVNFSTFSDSDLLDYYLPLIRADMYLANQLVFSRETYCYFPILFYFGEDDPWLNEEDVEDWKRLTDGKFEQIKLPGNHMFIYQKKEKVIDFLQCRLNDFK